ncbi:hypothetical protein [Jannaschia sp. W003]|uniref:hypothetical protein n=1 Tax=Jannaschia sp. W003 TaxID=2867012 RepID=UPI0021A464DD|nr:hypothetical protein [Jannaschia sp. W003]UWQ20011.1 hypothetical protein K3554_08275 [Jannaschia sp. W003]
MLLLVRILAVVLVIQTVVFWSLLLYLRWGERDRLEAEWERERPPLPRERYVTNGLETHGRRTRRRLLVGVYAIPMAVIVALIWWLNYS